MDGEQTTARIKPGALSYCRKVFKMVHLGTKIDKTFQIRIMQYYTPGNIFNHFIFIYQSCFDKKPLVRKETFKTFIQGVTHE